MIQSILRAQAVALFIVAPLAAAAETATTSWSDPNFALCEGIGGWASGRVNAHAEFERSGGMLRVSSFSLTTSSHQHEH